MTWAIEEFQLKTHKFLPSNGSKAATSKILLFHYYYTLINTHFSPGGLETVAPILLNDDDENFPSPDPHNQCPPQIDGDHFLIYNKACVLSLQLSDPSCLRINPFFDCFQHDPLRSEHNISPILRCLQWIRFDTNLGSITGNNYSEPFKPQPAHTIRTILQKCRQSSPRPSSTAYMAIYRRIAILTADDTFVFSKAIQFTPGCFRCSMSMVDS